MELILGHNQFIGISHTSETKSREKEKIFSKVENIYRLVEAANDIGYKNMMIETHPRMLEYLTYCNENRTIDMSYYLQVPYVHGYIQKMNEKGIHGLIADIIGKIGIIGASKLALKSLIDWRQHDYLSIATQFLKLEVAPFTDVKIKAILLHNVVTDLLLALDVSDAFVEYHNFLNDNIHLRPGFVTLNFPMLTTKFNNWHIKPTLIMTPLNVKGYDMNPSQKLVEDAIGTYNGEIIAMNILGGGAFSLCDTGTYLKSFNNVHHCIIGASSRDHLQELFDVLGSPSSY